MPVENNPILPARPDVLNLAGLDKPADQYSFRDAVEWHKKIVRYVNAEMLEMRQLEFNAVQQSWVALADAIAKREGVPPGFISYMLDQLAQSELRLGDTAQVEYNTSRAALEQMVDNIAKEREEYA